MATKQPVNRDMETPIGAYNVWHREGGQLHRVGSVKASSHLVAAEIVMKGPTARWIGEVPIGTPHEAVRQTRTGDVIECPDGQALRVAGTEHGYAFEATTLGQERETLKLMREYAEDREHGLREEAVGEVMGASRLGEVLARAEVPEPPAPDRDRGAER